MGTRRGGRHPHRGYPVKKPRRKGIGMADNTTPRIRVSKDGPYLLDHSVPVEKQSIVVDEAGESVAWETVESLPQRAPCALCRCGSSSVKPYCDGTHHTIGFDGTETASRAPYEDAAHALTGPVLVLMDEKELCAEARFCSAKGTAWHRVENGDQESCDVVIEEAGLCPSGRYTAVDAESGQVHEPPLDPSIALIEDPSQGVSGPLWVRGGIHVESAEGTAYPVRNRVTLCRCGGSKNKPFCDATHVDIGFSDAE